MTHRAMVDKDVSEFLGERTHVVGQVADEYLANINEADPPAEGLYPLPYLNNYRHPCTKARQSKGLAGKGVSTAIALKEAYVTLGEVLTERNMTTPEALPNLEALGGEIAVTYREGRCPKCQALARSDRARVVLTATRPPISGRVGRE